MKKLFYYLFICCISIFLFTACSDDDDKTPEEEPFEEELRGDISTSETIPDATAMIGDVPADMREALEKRFTNITNDISDVTRVVLITCPALSAKTEQLLDLYDDGGMIIIVRPDLKQMNDWFDKHKLQYGIYTEKNNINLFAFCANHQYIQDAPGEGTTINESLNDFTSWMNNYLKSNEGQIGDPGENETKIEKIAQVETYTHSYSYEHYFEETKYKEKMGGKGQITAKYSVYPVYVFEDQAPQNGDYYIVSAEVTAHNKDMCQYDATTHNYTKWINGAYYRICGYYMIDFKIGTRLTDKDSEDSNLAVEFPQGYSPTPLTTQSSTTYSHGFTWNIGVDASIGWSNNQKYNGSVTVSGGVSYSDQKTRNLDDINIYNNSTSSKVQYTYHVPNLPEPKVPIITDPVPVSVGNATFFEDWIWRVPSTKDYSDQCMYISTNAEIKYGSCHYWGAGTSADFWRYEHDIKMTPITYSKMKAPNRVPTGRVKITNSDEGMYVDNISITRKGETTPIYNSKDDDKEAEKGAIPFEKAFSIYIPVGEYNIEFDLGPNTKKMKRYKLSDGIVSINRAQTLELYSSFDFIPVE